MIFMLKIVLALSCLFCFGNAQQSLTQSGIANTEVLIQASGESKVCDHPSSDVIGMLQTLIDTTHKDLSGSPQSLTAHNNMVASLKDLWTSKKQLFKIDVAWSRYIPGTVTLGLIVGLLRIASTFGMSYNPTQSESNKVIADISQPEGVASKKEIQAVERKLAAVDALRLLAVIHIVFRHFGPPSTSRFNKWGNCWLSFFFPLSGFGATHAKLARPGIVSSIWPKPGTLFRRWTGVYPTYLFAIVWLVIERLSKDSQIEVSTLVMEVAMFPVLWQAGQERFNFPDWFCTWLVPCWLLEELLFLVASSCWHRGFATRAILACSGIITYMLLLNYGFAYDYYSPLSAFCLGLLWILSYFCGIIVAFCVSAECFKDTWLCKTSASFSLSLILAIITLTDAGRASCFVLLPLMCLLLYGLGMGCDPLTSLFGRVPSAVRDLSLGIYLLQVPAHRLWMEWSASMLTFFVLLSFTAGATYFVVQKPLGNLLKRVARV
mmetsp:Transcript_35403/g.62820  ORF Transcript_35403/g.62820 Transcript_35403/m.62820 type:complete len:491 (+) Transcript_35403:36-1508(+)